MKQALVNTPPPTRGPKPRFTREEIVATAVGLLARDGRAALNLRLLAGELGVTPMALYRYFDGKDELLDAIVAAVLAPAADAADAGGAWDRQLETTIRAMHDALHGAPAVAEIMATRRPGTRLDPLRERLFAIAGLAGMTEQEAADTLRALTSYVLGFTLVTRPEERHAHHGASPASFDFGLALLLDSLRTRYGGPARPVSRRRSPPPATT